MQMLSYDNLRDRIAAWSGEAENSEDQYQSAWRFWRMGSLPVCAVGGVDIRIHVLALSGVFLHFAPLQFLALMLALLLHEAGHAIAARMNACEVRGIVLLPPIGAVTIGDVSPQENPVGALIIAAAGPLINILVWSSIMPVCKGLGLIQSYGTYRFLNDLAEISKIIGFVNLLPLWPLDGGRMMHSALTAMQMRERSVEVITFWISALCFVAAFWWCWSQKNYWNMGLLVVLIVTSYWAFMKKD